MRERVLWWATGLGLVALFVALGFLRPALADGPEFCLFHRVTGIACPGCGLTRAAAALAQGDFAASLRWHPLFLLLAAEAGGAWLAWGFAPGAARRLAPSLALATGVLLVAVWIVRLANGALPA
jgi:hypothetical protein